MNTLDYKVSIIVPVYNREKSIIRCLDSIVNQTYRNIEVIVIDDGSTDLSFNICKEFANNNNRIIVFHKENGGVSSARNLGLEHASGDIIVFVDSDDFVLSSYIETIVNTFISNDVDIVVTKFATGDEFEKDYQDPPEVSIIGTYSSVDFEKLLYTSKNWCEHGMVMCVWGKGYKKYIFDDVRFEGRFSEDYVITDEIYSRNYLIKVTDEIGYIYCYSANSLVRNASALERSVFLSVLEKRLKLFDDNEFIVNNTCKLFCNLYIEYYFTVNKIDRNQIINFRTMFIHCIKTLRMNHVKDRKFYARMLIFMISPYVYGKMTSMDKLNTIHG